MASCRRIRRRPHGRERSWSGHARPIGGGIAQAAPGRTATGIGSRRPVPARARSSGALLPPPGRRKGCGFGGHGRALPKPGRPAGRGDRRSGEGLRDRPIAGSACGQLPVHGSSHGADDGRSALRCRLRQLSTTIDQGQLSRAIAIMGRASGVTRKQVGHVIMVRFSAGMKHCRGGWSGGPCQRSGLASQRRRDPSPRRHGSSAWPGARARLDRYRRIRQVGDAARCTADPLSRCRTTTRSEAGGDGGIRTPDRGLGPYNGLANRRLQPLGHVSTAVMSSGGAAGVSIAVAGSQDPGTVLCTPAWSDGFQRRTGTGLDAWRWP